MEPIAESKVLTGESKLTLQLGPYTYEIKRDGKQEFLFCYRWKEHDLGADSVCGWSGQNGPDVCPAA